MASRLSNTLDQYFKQKDLRQSNWVFRDVARLGGDEFTILINDVEDLNINEIGNYILANMEPSYFLEQYHFHITTSIGVVCFPDHGDTPEQLLKNADASMYRAKELGKNRFQLYEPDMSRLTLRRYEIKNALRHAISNDELTLLYQPQYDIQREKVIGCEALLRWHNPQLGVIGPDEFIPIAEDSGLIIELGEWVLQQAAKTAAKINAHRRFKIAINVSAVQLRQSDITSLVKQYLQKYQLSTDAIEVEITESVMIDQGKKTQHSLLDLKQSGVHISMDDFGTGYSSLSQIQTLPLYCVKIDKSFIGRCTHGPQGKSIVLAIIALAQQLGLKTTAEGVESPEELALLRQAGCSYVQGYLISKPLTELELEGFVAASESSYVVETD